jgi:predicted GIY-YIG superfamily endonuclease
MVQWYVYMLRCADASLYTGVATDVEARVLKHNSGKGAKYTRSRLPVVLAYQEAAADRSAALRREAQIKRLRLADKQRLLAESV